MTKPSVKHLSISGGEVLVASTDGQLFKRLEENKNKMKSLLCFFVLLTNVVLCQASPINFESLVGQTVALTVEPYASGENNGNYYVGLTQGVIDGQTFYMFCNDFQDEISVPTTYDVTVVGLTASTFTTDKLGLTLTQLQQQTTLGANFGLTPSGNSQADSDAQQAIWNYTGGTYANDSGMLADIATMQATYQTNNYSGSFLLDITSEPGEQSFMTDPSDLNPTPEPVSLVLLGSGLLIFGLYGRRRARG
jgi:hypothetical protein